MNESDLVYNEQLKALAAMFHNSAVASITSAILVPLVVANTTPEATVGYPTTLPFGSGLALCFGWLGQRMLKDLRG